MVQVHSKFQHLNVKCVEYVHPWTDSCVIASAGLLISAAMYSFRIYTAVYLLSLLMRGKIPTRNDLKHTIMGIIQSTAFLTTNAFTYSIYLCTLRSYFGYFNYYTIAFIPSFLASLTAILVERPSRRGLLSLYVSNIATESLWHILLSRGIIKRIKYGNILLFGISTSIIIYYFRNGHHLRYKDSIFDVVRFVIGKEEENINGNHIIIPNNNNNHSNGNSIETSRIKNILPFINYIIKKYSTFINYIKNIKKTDSCKHYHSCIHYTLIGGFKLLTTGICLQLLLKIVLQTKGIIKEPRILIKILMNKNNLRLGMFLGGYGYLYRLVSCFMRFITKVDSPLHALPAGMIASVAFTKYPDNSVALYILWKMLQITYNMGIDKKILPKIPGFTILLYCVSTAMLFHGATFEPTRIRQSYWKFLEAISGGRIATMDRTGFEIYGVDALQQLQDVLNQQKNF